MHEASISAPNLRPANILVQIRCVKASENQRISSTLGFPDQNYVYQVSLQAVQLS